jgi:hypothetical protein
LVAEPLRAPSLLTMLLEIRRGHDETVFRTARRPFRAAQWFTRRSRRGPPRARTAAEARTHRQARTLRKLRAPRPSECG